MRAPHQNIFSRVFRGGCGRHDYGRANPTAWKGPDGRSHLAQFTLSFRQSFVIRHLLHQRGNWGTESLDQLID
jgi:hypothetical protein